MRLPPIVLLTGAVALVGSNSLALSPIALEVGRGVGGASAQEVLVATSLFGAGTALAAVLLAPHADRIGLSRALFLALASGSALALVAGCLTWGMINHMGLNLIVGRLAGMDAARRGAILGLNSGVTYLAMFLATPLFGLVEARAGFAACAVLAAGFVVPALVDGLRRRAGG